MNSVLLMLCPTPYVWEMTPNSDPASHLCAGSHHSRNECTGNAACTEHPLRSFGCASLFLFLWSTEESLRLMLTYMKLYKLLICNIEIYKHTHIHIYMFLLSKCFNLVYVAFLLYCTGF